MSESLTSSENSRVHKKRNSSIELLRIIAMIMIVAHHFGTHTNWASGGHLIFNEYWVEILKSFGKIGVGIFFAITGYFLYNRRSFKYRKIFDILIPTWTYSFIFLIIAFILKDPITKIQFPLNIRLLRLMMPVVANGYWFVTAYTFVFLISPYLKKWFDVMSQRDIIIFLLITCAFNSVIATFKFLTASTFEFPYIVISPVVCCLLIGYSINRFKDQLQDKNWPIFAFTLSTAVLILAPLILILLSKLGYHDIPGDLFTNIASITSLVFITSILIIFQSFNFSSKWVDLISGATFGIYLIHDNNIMYYKLWRGQTMNVASHLTLPKIDFVLYSIQTIFGVFLACLVIELIRQFIFKLIYKMISAIFARRKTHSLN